MRAARVLLAALGLFIALPASASAHPLGNFTINHFARVTVAADEIRVLYVVDMAEIPTVSERQRIDADDDGNLTSAETDAYLADAVPQLVAGLELRIDGARMPLREGREARIGFVPGQAGLSTLRLELDLVADMDPDAAGATVIGTFTDATFADRIGWREIVVAGSGVTLLDSSVSSASISDELRSYPDDGLEDPIDIHEATFRAQLTSRPDADLPASATGTGAANDSQDPLAGLLADGGSDAFAALLAVLVSLGLGAAHAASPGHGKTLVAAYLIGTGGTPRQALTLGLTVAITHTIGVFVLGGVVLGASELLVPERVVEWLAIAAGVIVVGMGTSLTVRALLARRSHPHPHSHGHGHDHHHHHPHEAPRVPGRSVAMIGLAGGLVPSASALIVLLVAVSQGQLVLGIALIAAFGAGMALALGAIGLAVVMARRRVERGGLAMLAHPAVARIGSALPVGSALVVLGVGIVLTLEAIGRFA